MMHHCYNTTGRVRPPCPIFLDISLFLTYFQKKPNSIGVNEEERERIIAPGHQEGWASGRMGSQKVS